jgi:hypothetical protein
MASIESFVPPANIPNLYSAEMVADITPAEIPAIAAEFFVHRSNVLTLQPALKIDEFDRLMKVETEDGITTFFAQHDKYYDRIEKTDRVIYGVDVNQQAEKLGHSEILFALTDESDYFLNKPFVFMTNTAEQYRRQGLAVRRLLAMNAVALNVFGLPLHSDTLRTDAATNTWEHLLKLGLVEEYHQASSTPNRPPLSRYRFKS